MMDSFSAIKVTSVLFSSTSNPSLAALAWPINSAEKFGMESLVLDLIKTEDLVNCPKRYPHVLDPA